MEHDPAIVASIAAALLDHRQLSVEPHHIREAVTIARAILVEAHSPETPAA
ncbi:MAG: hypothetical protein JWR80_8103 [Bradyrhizobium sp.]|nr:hypothetical protein [Bradyrhizobium sp.]